MRTTAQFYVYLEQKNYAKALEVVPNYEQFLGFIIFNELTKSKDINELQNKSENLFEFLNTYKFGKDNKRNFKAALEEGLKETLHYFLANNRKEEAIFIANSVINSKTNFIKGLESFVYNTYRHTGPKTDRLTSENSFLTGVSDATIQEFIDGIQDENVKRRLITPEFDEEEADEV